VRVRYADTDASGAAHHAAYLVYFEVARVEALRGLGVPVGEFAARGVAMPVVEAGLKYLRPALLDGRPPSPSTTRSPATVCCWPRAGRAWW
jgi:acyl-CoA thioester hydrolase